MKKTIFLLIVFCCTRLAMGQTTLTASNFGLNVGTTIPVARSTSANLAPMNLDAGGANQVWNAAGLVQQPGTPNINLMYNVPAGTPFASDAPNANLCRTDPALASIVGYEYYFKNSDTMVVMATHTAGQSYEIFSNPDLHLAFPLAYGQSVSGTYAKTNYMANGSISSFQTGNRTITYDGFGTLILPSGTYTNVAHIRSDRTNSLGPNTSEYIFLDMNTGTYLLVVGVNFLTSGVVYRASAPSGLTLITDQNFAAMSDGNEGLLLSHEDAIEAVHIYSANGQLLYNHPTAGSNRMRIELSGVRGLIMIQAKTSSGWVVRKVVL